MRSHGAIVQRRLEEAGFEQRIPTRESFDARMVEMQASLAKKVARIDPRLAAFDSKLAAFDTKLAELKAEMIKWMVGLVAGSTLTMVVALLRLTK